MDAFQPSSIGALAPVLRFGERGAATSTEPQREEIVVDIERLVGTRLLIQAESGGGKSWMIRYLLEETHGKLPHLLFDFEGEFASLRERYPYVLVSATEGEGDLPARPEAAASLCRSLFELGASAILDLFDLDGPDQQRFVRLFLEELLSLPRSLWGPRLVVVDEADRLAPEKGQADSAPAVHSLAKRGRKRGLGPVLAVQRLSDLDKAAAGGLQNKLVGLTTLDTDVRRVAEDLGFDKEARAALKELAPGEFFAFGPAFPHKGVALVRSGGVSTTHEHGADEAASQVPPPPGELSEVLRRLSASLEAVDPPPSAGGDPHRRAAPPSRTEDAARARTEEEAARLGEELARLRRRAEALTDRCSSLEEENARLRAAIATAEGHARNLMGILSGDVTPNPAPVAEEEEIAPVTEAPPIRERPAEDAPPASPPNGRPRRDARRRILAALRDLEALGVASLPRKNLAVFAGQGPRSSAFRDRLAALKDEDLVVYPAPGAVALTEKGRSAAGKPGTGTRTLEDLHEAWRRRLRPASAAILSALLVRHPEDLPRDELAAESDQSPRSSAFRDRIAELRSIGMIEYPAPGRVGATKLLFPEGLLPKNLT